MRCDASPTSTTTANVYRPVPSTVVEIHRNTMLIREWLSWHLWDEQTKGTNVCQPVPSTVVEIHRSTMPLR
jgi:hypothetical protein